MRTPRIVLTLAIFASTGAANAQVAEELAGELLTVYPHVAFVDVFNAGTAITVGVDTTRHTGLIGQTVGVYVVADKSTAAWALDPTLVDLTANVETFQPVAGGVVRNTLVVDTGVLPAVGAPPFAGLGLGYDVIFDVDGDGLLGPGDLIDGEDGAGLYVVRDTTQPGPFAVTEVLYTGGVFLGQNTFYPTDIASLGKLPLVTVSHGGGQNYQWYDHIGTHLASYGFVVMSHENNVNPGIVTGAESVLANIEYFLGNLPSIVGGVLDGHVDETRMLWIGHSRGGESVARVVDLIDKGLVVPQHFTLDAVKLVSTIAPTDFLAPHTHQVPYHMWVGSADSQMTCADCKTCGVYTAHDRALHSRLSITLHGAGHNDFHAGLLGAGGIGPCQIGKANTQQIVRGYVLPLAAHYLKASVPAEEFFWRQWEAFRPVGAPLDPCVKVDLTYRPELPGAKLVIDDFQTVSETNRASSGSRVVFDVTDLHEGLMSDNGSVFTHDPADPMNGMVRAKPGDPSRGVIFSFAKDAQLGYVLAPGLGDWRAFDWLSFRACQAARHPDTLADDGDTVFEVGLWDGAGNHATISIGAYGGGVEEPYPRNGCGDGVGWFNQFETIRLRLDDFTRAGSDVDLGNVVGLAFLFGPSRGTPMGRLALDDVELLAD